MKGRFVIFGISVSDDCDMARASYMVENRIKSDGYFQICLR